MTRQAPLLAPMPTLGVGITYAPQLDTLLQQYSELFNVIELEPQTLWKRFHANGVRYEMPPEVIHRMNGLPGHKLVHSIGVPVGGTVRPEPEQLELLAHTIKELKSPWVSDHLGFNSTAEFNTGFFLPPRQTQQGIETAAQAIHDLKNALGVPVAVETGVNYLKYRTDELEDGFFTANVIQAADCGLLLDLHNIFANALNGRQSVDDFINQLPLERVWEIHLAGGLEMDGFWLDAHSGAIPDLLFAIAKRIIPRLPNLKAIIFEIFPAYIPSFGFDAIRVQMERLHELWELRTPSVEHLYAHSQEDETKPTPALALQTKIDTSISPSVWEKALGRLAIGHPATEPIAEELNRDPGIKVINRLINEFRGSMVVRVFRLTSRYFVLMQNSQTFRNLLAGFWRTVPPKPFTSDEAEAFALYLQQLQLPSPVLYSLLEFELAVLRTLLDEQSRVVAFEFDPIPLLRSLADSKLPEITLQKGNFEIEITPDNPFSGLNRNRAMEVIAPYH